MLLRRLRAAAGINLSFGIRGLTACQVSQSSQSDVLVTYRRTQGYQLES